MYRSIIAQLIIYFLFNSAQLYSQEKTDSIKNVLSVTETDTAKVNNYNKLFRAYLYSNVDSAEHYVNKALIKSKSIKFRKGEADSYINLTSLNRTRGLFKQSVDNAYKALEIYSNQDDTFGIFTVYSTLTLTNYYLGNSEKAFDYNIKALDLAKEMGLKDIQRNYNYMGLLFSVENKVDSALYYYEKSIKISREVNDKEGIIYSYGNIANIYKNEGNDEKAIEIYLKIIKLSEELNDKNAVLLSNMNLSEIYYDKALAAKDNSIKNKLIQQSVDYAEKALFLAEELNSLVHINYSSYGLSLLYKETGNYKKAYEHLKQYSQTTDSLYNINKIKEIEILQKQFNTEQQKQKIEGITKENELNDAVIKNKNQVIILGYIAISLIFFLTVFLFSLYRKKKNANEQLKELNEDINSQRAEIITQRDNLSELAFELKKTNKTKDKYFSVLAHDLKNPFQSILGFSELLKNDIEQKDYSKLDTYARFIYETGKNTYALLENLLDWARLQRGAIEYQPKQFNLFSLINETVYVTKGIADTKEISINVEINKDDKIYVDKYMFSTAIRNLISNAIKFTEQGGEINISAKHSKTGYINVLVSDTGIGIKAEKLKRIFKLDKRGSSKGTKRETGTGLGLLLCKEFTEQNLGTVSVESEVGTGSTFTLTLPTDS